MLDSSQSQGFPKKSRLLNAHDYSRVFDKVEHRFSTKHFLLLVRKNQNLGCRLGVIVAKKHVKLAVCRNRIKRLIRESFRLSETRPKDLDVIVLAKVGAARHNKRETRAELDKLWQKMINRI